MIDIDKELEWIRENTREVRHMLDRYFETEGSISKHEYVVDVDWMEELVTEVKRLREELNEYEKYSICHPDGKHCCDECLERNGFEVKK